MRVPLPDALENLARGANNTDVIIRLVGVMVYEFINRCSMLMNLSSIEFDSQKSAWHVRKQ